MIRSGESPVIVNSGPGDAPAAAARVDYRRGRVFEPTVESGTSLPSEAVRSADAMQARTPCASRLLKSTVMWSVIVDSSRAGSAPARRTPSSSGLPQRSTVVPHEVRRRHKRRAQPSMVMIDAQTVRGGRFGPTFHNAGGRGGRTVGAKRSILVKILALPVAVRVDPAKPHDVRSGRDLLRERLPDLPSLTAIVADRGYRGLAGRRPSPWSSRRAISPRTRPAPGSAGWSRSSSLLGDRRSAQPRVYGGRVAVIRSPRASGVRPAWQISRRAAAIAIVAPVQRPPWDPEKARPNFDKHGVTFEEARVALNHPLARQWPDPEHSDDEDRSIVIGLSPGGRLLLIVTATGVNGKMRIISARRATKRERHAYQDG